MIGTIQRQYNVNTTPIQNILQYKIQYNSKYKVQYKNTHSTKLNTKSVQNQNPIQSQYNLNTNIYFIYDFVLEIVLIINRMNIKLKKSLYWILY